MFFPRFTCISLFSPRITGLLSPRITCIALIFISTDLAYRTDFFLHGSIGSHGFLSPLITRISRIFSPRITRISRIIFSTYRTDLTDFFSTDLTDYTDFFPPLQVVISTYLTYHTCIFLHVSHESLVYFFHVLLQLIVSTDRAYRSYFYLHGSHGLHGFFSPPLVVISTYHSYLTYIFSTDLTDYTDFFPPLVVISTYLTYHTCIFLHGSLESLVLYSPRITRISRIFSLLVIGFYLHLSLVLFFRVSHLFFFSTYHSNLSYYILHGSHGFFISTYHCFFSPRISLIFFSPRITRISRIIFSTYRTDHSYFLSLLVIGFYLHGSLVSLVFFPLITGFYLHGSHVSLVFFSHLSLVFISTDHSYLTVTALRYACTVLLRFSLRGCKKTVLFKN